MTDLPQSNFDEEPFDLEHKTLDETSFEERDWGGDGSDKRRPVRAHMLAALRPDMPPYTSPVDALLRLGDPRKDNRVEQHRRELGIQQEHVPELLRMARDRALYTADGDTDEVWGSLHAVAVLHDFDIGTQVDELIPLFDLDDDWYAAELPELFGKVGEPALESLRDYLLDQTRWGYGHWVAATALEKVASQHPELRDRVVEILSDIARTAEQYDETTVTGAIDALLELQAVEALPSIRHALEIGKTDESVHGAWDDVLKELGLEPEEGDPLVEESRRRFEERREKMMPSADRERLLASLDRFVQRQGSAPTGQSARVSQPTHGVANLAKAKVRKQKNKRKQEAASRKANRKKRK